MKPDIAIKFLIPLLLTALTAFGGVVEFTGDGVRIEARDARFTEESEGGKSVLKAQFDLTEKWSFVRILPVSGVWDLSKYSGIEVQITNDGGVALKPGVRVDEAGDTKDQKWNTAPMQAIAPGETKVIRVEFGKDYNNPKPLDTSRVAAIQIFLGKNRDSASSLTIGDIRGVK